MPVPPLLPWPLQFLDCFAIEDWYDGPSGEKMQKRVEKQLTRKNKGEVVPSTIEIYLFPGHKNFRSLVPPYWSSFRYNWCGDNAPSCLSLHILPSRAFCCLVVWHRCMAPPELLIASTSSRTRSILCGFHHRWLPSSIVVHSTLIRLARFQSCLTSAYYTCEFRVRCRRKPCRRWYEILRMFR